MTKITTTQKLAQLKQLAADAKTNLYQRVKLAVEILADRQYVDSVHGSEDKAMHFLQSEGFPYIEKTVGQLVAIYNRFPNEDDWDKRNYNLTVMWDEVKAAKKKQGKPTDERVSWKQKYEELEQEYELLRAKYTVAERRIAELEGELKGIREMIGKRDAA